MFSHNVGNRKGGKDCSPYQAGGPTDQIPRMVLIQSAGSHHERHAICRVEFTIHIQPSCAALFGELQLITRQAYAQTSVLECSGWHQTKAPHWMHATGWTSRGLCVFPKSPRVFVQVRIGVYKCRVRDNRPIVTGLTIKRLFSDFLQE